MPARGSWTHPATGSQRSFVQASPSLQSDGAQAVGACSVPGSVVLVDGTDVVVGRVVEVVGRAGDQRARDRHRTARLQEVRVVGSDAGQPSGRANADTAAREPDARVYSRAVRGQLSAHDSDVVEASGRDLPSLPRPGYR